MIGEKSEVYYFYKDGNMVDSVEDSYRCIARELDENGKLVSEVFGYVNYKPEYKREDTPELTEEEKKN
mgnify:CR=1 FL=1